MRLLLAIAALTAVLLPAPAAAEAASRRVPHGFHGVMWDRAVASAPAAQQDAQWALMASSGVESVRTVISWARIQPVAGTGPDFRATDELVARAARHGIRLLPIVLETPVWARRYPGREGSPPRRAADLTAFLRALVGRYGPRGTLWAERPGIPRRPLRDWQIWNEPHLDQYWYARGRGARSWAPGYAAMLHDAYHELKEADLGSRVVLAGLADYAWRHLAALYREGVKGHFDVATINLFTSRPALVLKGVRYFRRALRRGKEPRKPVWLTETTWPASKGRLPKPGARWQLFWETNDAGMASRVGSVYSLAARARRRLRLGRVFWYTWASAYGDSDRFDYAGLLRFDGGTFAPTPALGAYARSSRRLQGCSKTTAGTCR